MTTTTPLNLRVLSWNIRGLHSNKTNNDKIAILKSLSSNIDIIFLQETHAKTNSNHFAQLHYHSKDFTWFHSTNMHSAHATRGVSVGIRHCKFSQAQVITCDPWGRGTSIKCQYQCHTIQLSSIYCPKEDLPDLFNTMPIQSLYDIHIIGGDFNTYVDSSNVSFYQAFDKWCMKKKVYPIPNKIPTHAYGHIIDHICVSSSINNDQCSISVLPGPTLDHNILIGTIDKLKRKAPIMKRIPREICKSKPFINEILRRIGVYERGKISPLNHLAKFKKTAMELFDKNTLIIPRADNYLTIQKLCSIRSKCPYERDHLLEFESSPFIRETISRFLAKFPRDSLSRKKIRSKWRNIIHNCIQTLSANFGIPVKHLLRNRKIKYYGKKDCTNSHVIDPITNTPASEERTDELLNTYWSNLLGNDRPYDPDLLDNLIKSHKKIDPHKYQFSFNKDNFKRIFKKPRTSCPGIDGIPFDLHQNAFPYLEDMWEDIIKDMANGSASPPSNFTDSILFLQPKVSGECSADQFRPITVTNTDYRLIMSYWANILKDIANDLVSPAQRALLSGRTIDECLWDIGDDYLNSCFHDKRIYLLQTDFTKAYDFINREAIMYILIKLGLPQYILHSVQIILSPSNTTIARSNTPSFLSIVGVKQGCPISPLIFIIVADILVARISIIKGVRLVRAYVDDNGITLDNLNCLDQIYHDITLYCNAVSAKLNTQKSLLVTPFVTVLPEIWKDLQIVTSTTYLGIHLSHIYSQTNTWSPRIGTFSARCTWVRGLNLPTHNKINLINTYAFSTLMYAGRFGLTPISINHIYFDSIKRALGMAGNYNISNLTDPYSWSSVRPQIKHLFIYSVAALLAKTPKANELYPASPISLSGQRAQAFEIFKSITKFKKNDPIITHLSDEKSHMEWRCYLKSRGFSPTSFIYKLIFLHLPKYISNCFLQQVCPSPFNHQVLIYNLQLHNLDMFKHNIFISVINKKRFIGKVRKAFGLANNCPFCNARNAPHLHFISECKIIKLTLKKLKIKWTKFSTKPMNLLMCNVPMTPTDVNCHMLITTGIFHAITLNIPANRLYKFMRQWVGKKPKITKFTKPRKPPRSKPPLPDTPYYTYSDGSTRLTPNISGTGGVLYYNNEEIAAVGCSIWLGTISIAEGRALINILRCALKHNIKNITSYSDSTLIVELGTLGSTCTNPSFLQIHTIIQSLIKKFQSYTIHHCPREFNSRADAIAFAFAASPLGLIPNGTARSQVTDFSPTFPMKELKNYSYNSVNIVAPFSMSIPLIPTDHDFAYQYTSPSFRGGEGCAFLTKPTRHLKSFFLNISIQSYFDDINARNPLDSDLTGIYRHFANTTLSRLQGSRIALPRPRNIIDTNHNEWDNSRIACQLATQNEILEFLTKIDDSS